MGYAGLGFRGSAHDEVIRRRLDDASFEAPRKIILRFCLLLVAGPRSSIFKFPVSLDTRNFTDARCGTPAIVREFHLGTSWLERIKSGQTRLGTFGQTNSETYSFSKRQRNRVDRCRDVFRWHSPWRHICAPKRANANRVQRYAGHGFSSKQCDGRARHALLSLRGMILVVEIKPACGGRALHKE